MSERLLVMQSGFLGDAVLASGMLRVLAAARPGAEIGLVVRAEFAPLFERHPALTRLHPFDKKKDGAAARLVEAFREAGYDTAFLPHRSYRTATLARKGGIARRIGFRQSEGARLLTDRVEYLIALHETERNMMLLRRAGIERPEEGAAATAPWLVPEAEGMNRLRQRLAIDDAPVLVAPGSVWGTKRWGVDGYAALIGRLRRQGRRLLLIGSGGERELCARIAGEAGLPEGENLAGELDLAELLALVALASRVIANDSAPLHLAESVGTPVTAIFGPTVPEFGFGPRGSDSRVVGIEGLACRPCRIHGSDRCPIGTHECMTRITPEMVLAASGLGAG